MSNFPNKIDDDVTLPPVNNNITEIGGDAINALREAVFNIEEEIGIGASGNLNSIAARIGVSIDPDGYIRPSVLDLSSAFPIKDNNIAPKGPGYNGIQESKLDLNYGTSELYGYYKSVSSKTLTNENWINDTGSKISSHVFGSAYQHLSDKILFSKDLNDYLENRFTNVNPGDPASIGNSLRDNTNLFTLITDLNSDYLIHQKMDGYELSEVRAVRTLSGDSYPSNFAHTASGIYLNSSNYSSIPTDIDNVQKFADYVDSNSMMLLGSRVQSLFTSGIPRTSRSTSLTNDGHGTNIIPETDANCYLTDSDNPSTGYDIIELKPTEAQKEDLFASKFSLIKSGDIATVTYSNVGSPTAVTVGTKPNSAALSSTKAYITNFDNDSISVINLTTKSVETTVSVQSEPKHISITPDESKCVIASNSKFITILNTSTNIATDISVDSADQQHVAISNSGKLAIVANANNKAYIVNLETDTLAATIACGTNPVYCAINDADTIAAVVNKGSNNATFINLQTYQVISTINCGSVPVAGKFYSASYNFIVANSASNSVSLIRTNSGIPTSVVGTIPCGLSPKEIAITPNGKVAAVINGGGSSINLIDLETESPISIVNCDSNPTDIAITADGAKAFVTCTSTNKANVLSFVTNKIITKIDVGTSPVAIKITEDDKKAVIVNNGSKNVTLVNVQDVGVFQTQYTVKEKKTVWTATESNIKYSIRVDGKNLFDSTTATVKIDRALFNVQKGGALSISPVSIDSLNSLIISQPRGAVAIGNGFNPSELSSTCRNLYLILYPNGNVEEKVRLSPIDVTGDKGNKSGSYTLEEIVESTNKAFRDKNYRFNAFSYNGQFGIMLADSYRNASFSIIAGELDTSNGKYNNSSSLYQNNIINYSSDGYVIKDPLGFSTTGSGVASTNPADFDSVDPLTKADLLYKFPTKVFYPLKRNNFYIDGVGTEIDKFAHEKNQLTDENGDGYWLAKITGKTSNSPTGYDFTYTIDDDLKSTNLSIGKTAVVQPMTDGGVNDNFGRFVIGGIDFVNGKTEITFKNSIIGTLPTGSADVDDGKDYAIYFNSDSVSFNLTNAFENSNEPSGKNFKKNFEIFVNKSGKSLTSERAKLLYGGSAYTTVDGTVLRSSTFLTNVDIVKISPKLRGYLHNTTSKISLKINYNSTTGFINGRLYDSGPDSSTESSGGPTSYGKNKEIVRFCDDTGVDFIDFKFNFEPDEQSFSGKIATLQLFPSLALDDELLLIGSCQLNTGTKEITNVVDLRQFGNVSEKDISTSLINYINAPEKLIHSNGVINGFDASYSDGVVNISNGGTALVNGKFVQLGKEALRIPTLNEIYNDSEYPMFWAICVNESSQYEFVPLCDTFSGGVNAGSRNVVVRDAFTTNTSLNFVINSFLFKNLINDGKHLTPLYVIKVKITGTRTDPTFYDSDGVGNPELNDIRRFINNEPLNNSFTWASKSSELASYFKSFDAVKNWVNYYGDTSNVIKVRGTITIDSLSNDFSKFDRPVVFEGHGSVARFDISAQTFNIGQNMTYKNIKFKIISDTYCTISQSGSAGYCTFENVEFLSSSNDEYINFDTLKDYNTFINCLFTSKIKRLYISNNFKFENVVFNNLYTASSSSDEINLIKLGNNNSFVNCNFLNFQISTSAFGDGYLITYDGSQGNNNIFESCVFNSISSGRGGFKLKNNNKIVNCLFVNDITVSGTFLTLSSGNLIDNVIFGESLGASTFSWIVQQKQSAGQCAIQVDNKNTLKNIYGAGIISNSSDGYAIKINGYGNVVDNINFEEIKANIASINILNQVDNFIVNSKFKCLSKYGIYISATSSSSLNSRITINNNKLTYIYTGEEISSDNIKSSHGGLIFIKNNAKNITINNCIFNKSDKISNDNKCLTDSDGNKINLNNLIQTQTHNYPPIISIHALSDMVIESLSIDSCKFVGDSSEETNKYYAAIALTSEVIVPNDALSLKNVKIINNSSTNNSGLIISGTSNQGNITAENVVISQNNFSYISAYSSPSVLNGHILIDGNSCYGIMSLNYKGTSQVSGLDETGDMTISNNSTQFINVYVAGAQ